MKKNALSIIFSFILFAVFNTANAQDPEIFKQKGYKLKFINQDPKLDPAMKERMVKTFFQVYPVLVNEYNKKSLKEVTFVVDTTYDGVAGAANGQVTFSSNWLRIHPEDIDVITHEVMHIVQDYGNTNGPFWLTEGIADYVRYKFGVDNAGAKWALPDLKPDHSYKSSYRITARFLEWLERNGNKGIVKKMDKHMREHSYKDDLWKEYAGKSIDELWTAYTANPAL